MSLFRPHTLRIITMREAGYDENGDWRPSEEVFSEPVPCRYEPNGQARTIALPDGTAYRYSYTIYLTVAPCPRLEYGDLIELTSQDGTTVGRYEVKGFHRGQLDMKAWV